MKIFFNRIRIALFIILMMSTVQLGIGLCANQKSSVGTQQTTVISAGTAYKADGNMEVNYTTVIKMVAPGKRPIGQRSSMKLVNESKQSKNSSDEISDKSEKNIRLKTRNYRIETSPLFIYKGHTNTVWGVTISSDGNVLASGSQDKTVKLWNLRTRQLLRTFDKHQSMVFAVDFSPDNTSIASGSDEGTIYIWDVGSGIIRRRIDTGDRVYKLDFSPDGRFLAAALGDKTSKVWDTQTGQLKLLLKGHTDYVYAVSFSPDGRYLATASRDNEIKIWDAKNGRLLNTMLSARASMPIGAFWSLAFSPDGKVLVSGGQNELLRLWNFRSGSLIRSIVGNSDYVGSIAIAPSGEVMVTGEGNGIIGLWDLSTGKLIQIVNDADSYSVTTVAFSSDGKYIVSSGHDGNVKIWKFDAD